MKDVPFLVDKAKNAAGYHPCPVTSATTDRELKNTQAMPVGVPEHLEAEDEHDDDGGVEGVDRRDERGDAVAEQSRHDRHRHQRDDRAREDDQLVVTHR